MAQPQTNNTTEPVTSPAVNVNAQPVAPDATATTLPGTSSDPPNPSVSQFLASQLPTLDPQPGQNLPQSYTTEPNLAMNDGFSSSCYGSYPDLSGVYGCHGLPVQAQCGPGFNIINQTASELALELCVRIKHTQRLPCLILIALSVT